MTDFYRPPWYPNKDPHHNPFAVMNTMSGNNKTYYEEWHEKLAPGELQRLIAEYRRSVDQV